MTQVKDYKERKKNSLFILVQIIPIFAASWQHMDYKNEFKEFLGFLDL